MSATNYEILLGLMCQQKKREIVHGLIGVYEEYESETVAKIVEIRKSDEASWLRAWLYFSEYFDLDGDDVLRTEVKNLASPKLIGAILLLRYALKERLHMQNIWSSDTDQRLSELIFERRRRKQREATALILPKKLHKAFFGDKELMEHI